MSSLIVDDADLNNLIGRFSNAPVKIKDMALFYQAFTPRNVDTMSCYERLEFLGDSVLNLVITAYLYQRYPNQNEGFMTRMRSKLVSGSMLSALAVEHTQFSKYIRKRQLSPDLLEGEELRGQNRNHKLLEDVFEAFLGALYLDQGYTVVSAWLVGFYESYVDFAHVVFTQSNPKDVLKRYMHRFQGGKPTFEFETSRIDGGTVTVRIRDMQGNLISAGKGANKKDAEMNASSNALKYLDVACEK